MEADETLARVRDLMPKTDFALFSENWDVVLRNLQVANPRNRMALEYRMTYHLLLGAVDLVAENMWRLKDFDYDGIPPLWEQALVIHQSAPGAPAINLAGRSIRAETIARYKDFVAILAAYPDNRAAAREALKIRYGDTYWFYYMFERAPDLGRSTKGLAP
jgi:hypothetical protein